MLFAMLFMVRHGFSRLHQLVNNLLSRDQHLFGPGPKRILSLDGGGVRGAISIAFLERLERLVEEIEGKPTLLGDWFDLIGGTSTGGIIACALALGYKAAEIHKLYSTLGRAIFRKRFWRVAGLQARFDKKSLLYQLEQFIGNRSLDSEDLRTGLCLVTKRLDSGSAWVLTNNPKSKFWESPSDGSFVGNRHYPLVNVVRASTAAPYFFDPELIEIVRGEKPGLFIDGGLTPHNNPALQLFLMAAIPQYGLSWKMGKNSLMIVSIGTGSFRPVVALKDLRWIGSLGMAIRALTSQISESQQLVSTLMTWFGDTRTSWPINSELGDLGKTAPPGDSPFFRYLRYDILLEQKWLRDSLGVNLDQSTLSRYRRMDAPANIPSIYRLGAQAAEMQIKRDDLTLVA
jgi:hypothetical protein